MNVSIHQPDYIPWLGLFYKMYLSDVFIHLDDAQYSTTAAHNFNVVKTSKGSQRLKFPVEQHLGDPINAVRPKYELEWNVKHVNLLKENYGGARHFADVFPAIEEIYMTEFPDVATFNIELNGHIATQFGIKPRCIRSSEMNIHSSREQRVIELALATGGTKYISGNGARAYQVEEHFTDQGLALEYLDYKPIEYPQLWGEFLPCMSVLDYIFNCGYDWDNVIRKVAEKNGNR